MTSEELTEVLRLHKLWVESHPDGKRAYLERANLRGADLRGAYLRGAYLGDAYLGDADLRGAYLGDANLGGANLGGADLRDADLRDANLERAYLRGADLRGANLIHCVPDESGLTGYAMRGLRWPVYIRDGSLSIGCQTHDIEKWRGWTCDSDSIRDMHTDAPEFWRKHRDVIIAFADATMAMDLMEAAE